jgi:hypothetical protein
MPMEHKALGVQEAVVRLVIQQLLAQQTQAVVAVVRVHLLALVALAL